MKIKEFKFDRGWKLLLYFDILLPVIIYVIAFISGTSWFASLFHSYEMFIVSPIPNIQALSGIIGLIYHVGILAYTLIRKNYKDFAVCLIISLIIAAFFLTELNYTILRPLNFA